MAFVFLATLGVTVWLYVIVPKGFIPDIDNDQIYVSTEMAQGTSFATCPSINSRSPRFCAGSEHRWLPVERRRRLGSTSNTGRMFLQLKPRRQRQLTSAQIREALRPKLGRFPGVRVFMTLPPAIRIGGRSSRSTYEFTLQGVDTASCIAKPPDLTRQLRNCRLFRT